jgi:hypothetical protein
MKSNLLLLFCSTTYNRHFGSPAGIFLSRPEDGHGTGPSVPVPRSDSVITSSSLSLRKLHPATWHSVRRVDLRQHFYAQNRSVSRFRPAASPNSPVPANKQRFIPTSGTYPKGFLVGSINVGINPAIKTQPDLILVASEKPSWSCCVHKK